MNIQHLQNAIVLSKKLHFTKTAEEVNIVQPALSRQIQQLEDELGVKLFKRHKRKVEMTVAGEFFVVEIRKLLKQIDRICDKTRAIDHNGIGELRIGFTYSVMQSILPQVLTTIQHLRPGIQTILKDANNFGQFEMLLNGELDVGFATNPLVPPGLMGKTLRSDDFVLLLPPDHPVSQENYKDFSVFADEEFIFPPESDGTNYINLLESICLDAGFKPKVTHKTGSASTAFKLVQAGMGIFIEPSRSLQKQDMQLNTIVLRDIPQKADLTMIWNNDFVKEFPDVLSAISEIDDRVD